MSAGSNEAGHSSEPLLGPLTILSNCSTSGASAPLMSSSDEGSQSHSPPSSECHSVELGDPLEESHRTAAAAAAACHIPGKLSSSSSGSGAGTPTHVNANIVCTCGPTEEPPLHQSGLSLASVVTVGQVAAMRSARHHSCSIAGGVASSTGGTCPAVSHVCSSYDPMATDSESASYNGPICRICHLPAEEQRPLISPCRCAGTLQYIHAACLTKWLEISMRKHRHRGHPRCELCNFEYIRRKRFKVQSLRWPRVSRRDKVLHVIFLLSFLVMITCAVATVLCFLSDRNHLNTNGLDKSMRTSGQQGSGSKSAFTGGVSDNILAGGPGRSKNMSALSPEEAITLACGILFFLAFFVAMTVQIKSRHTIYQLVVKFLALNREWEIRDYERSRDPEWPLVYRGANPTATASPKMCSDSSQLAIVSTAAAAAAAVSQQPQTQTEQENVVLSLSPNTGTVSV